jgi:hypothetical protein
MIRPEGVAAEILDGRAECIAGFATLEPSAQHLLVHDIWNVGMRAVLNARADAQEAQLSDIAQTFQGDLAEQLERQTKQATELVQGVLAEYFGPESGCVGERLKHFVGDDGVLAQQLRRHLGAENSTLAATLAKNVGEQSPLFKKLSPTDTDGVVQTLAQQLRLVLHEEHGEFQKALDPLQVRPEQEQNRGQLGIAPETSQKARASGRPQVREMLRMRIERLGMDDSITVPRADDAVAAAVETKHLQHPRRRVNEPHVVNPLTGVDG